MGWGIDDVAGFLTGGQRLASVLLDTQLGKLDVGSAADLVVLDYPTPAGDDGHLYAI